MISTVNWGVSMIQKNVVLIQAGYRKHRQFMKNRLKFISELWKE